MDTSNTMDLVSYHDTLIEHLGHLTTVYVDFGVRYHDLAPYFSSNGANSEVSHFDIRSIFVNQPENEFLYRLSLLHTGVPHYAAAGIEPDNAQGGKRRWLEKLQEELQDLRETLVAAEASLEFMGRSMCEYVDQEMLANVTADRLDWEAAIAALGWVTGGIANGGHETQADQGDAMEE